MGKPANPDTALTPTQFWEPVYVESSTVDTLLNTSGNQTGLVSADLAVGVYHELALDFNLTSITGGTAPTFNTVVKRKGADGVYYSIDTATALSAAGSISRSLGAGLAQNVSFGDTIQVSVIVTGAPTGAAWTLSIKAKQAV